MCEYRFASVHDDELNLRLIYWGSKRGILFEFWAKRCVWVRARSMANHDVNYQALSNEGNPFIEKSNHATIVDDMTTDTENEDAHRDNGIIIHVVPDTSKGKLLGQFKS